MRQAAATLLLVLGYPVAVVVIARWVPVVRERRTTWFAAHTAAVVAIIAGWVLRRPAAAVPNVAWLAASVVWYLSGGPRARRPGGVEHDAVSGAPPGGGEDHAPDGPREA